MSFVCRYFVGYFSLKLECLKRQRQDKQQVIKATVHFLKFRNLNSSIFFSKFLTTAANHPDRQLTLYIFQFSYVHIESVITLLHPFMCIMSSPCYLQFHQLLQVYYTYTTSILKVSYKYTSSILQVYCKYTASILQVYYKYTTRILQVYYKYATSIPQVCHKYATSTLQVYYKYTKKASG